MVMFSTFEHSVDFLYQNLIQRRKEECSKVQQLGVTCLAGYAAGSVGSFISNPADNIVASMYSKNTDSLILVRMLNHMPFTILLKQFRYWIELCLLAEQAIKKIGLLNLFTRSLSIRILLVGPVVTLQWLFYDTIKVFSGL